MNFYVRRGIIRKEINLISGILSDGRESKALNRPPENTR